MRIREVDKYNVSVNDAHPHKFKTMPEVIRFLRNNVGMMLEE